MSEDNEVMDAEAPLPYKRRGKDGVKDVKFSYDEESTIVKTVASTPPLRIVTDQHGVITDRVQDPDRITTETTTTTRSRKVTLQTYSGSSDEDAEAYFHAFERLQAELKSTWDTVSSAKNKDASILFNAMDKMLLETANSEWHDVLSDTTNFPDQTWESFKKATARYIVSKVLDKDAYDKQMNYLNERIKPRKITARQWEHRFTTLNRFMVYMIGTMDELKEKKTNADWKDWWTQGSMNESEMRRIIIAKAPRHWKKALKLHMVEQRKLSVEAIIGYYTTLEGFESKGIGPARTGPNGRRTERRSNQDQRHGDRYDQRRNRYDRYGRSRYNRDDRYDRSSYNRRDYQNRYNGRNPNYRTSNSEGRGKAQASNGQRRPDQPRREQYQIEEADEKQESSGTENEVTEEQAYQAWNDHWDERSSDGGDSRHNDYSSGDEEDNYYMDAYDRSVWYG